MTALAPSASAFNTSVPRRTPPSTSTGTAPATALTTCNATHDTPTPPGGPSQFTAAARRNNSSTAGPTACVPHRERSGPGPGPGPARPLRFACVALQARRINVAGRPPPGRRSVTLPLRAPRWWPAHSPAAGLRGWTRSRRPPPPPRPSSLLDAATESSEFSETRQ
jgi:hypothetical protein